MPPLVNYSRGADCRLIASPIMQHRVRPAASGDVDALGFTAPANRNFSLVDFCQGARGSQGFEGPYKPAIECSSTCLEKISSRPGHDAVRVCAPMPAGFGGRQKVSGQRMKWVCVRTACGVPAKLVYRAVSPGRLRGARVALARPEGHPNSDQKRCGQDEKEHGLFEPRDRRHRKCQGEAQKTDFQR